MADFTTNKVPGGQVAAAEWNQLADLDNFTASSDQTPAIGDLDQIAKGVAAYTGQAGIYTTDSGVVDAYVVTQVSPFKAPHKLFIGLTIRFRTSNTNTGACTVNAFTLGVKNIKLDNGSSDPAVGDISTTKENVAVYDGTVFRLKNAASDAAGFRFGSIQTFTSSGTWTKPSGLRAVVVEVQAGGGGGAGTVSSSVGAGGGSGGYSQKFITSGLGATETVTIGAGGAGGASGGGGGSVGATGGSSSFGSHCSATGGTGANPNGSSGNGGVGSSGDLNINGNAGDAGQASSVKCGTSGAASPRFGGSPPGQIGAGIAGDANSGAGGGGGYNNTAGGAGGSGIVIVYEYY